jgi:hypothetical protein
MPITIPRIDPQVSPQGSPNARLNIQAPREAFGGGQSLDGVQRATEGLGRAILDEKRKADELVVEDFNSKLANLKNQTVFDPKEGLLTKKGKDAFSAPDVYGKRFDDGVEELQKGLSNDAQRFLARRFVDRHRAELDDTIQRHVFTESQKFAAEVETSAIQASIDDAAYNYQDPEKLQASLDSLKETVIRSGARNGEDQKVTSERLQDTISKAHTAVINRMLANGQDLGAKAYYNGVKDEVSGRDATVLDKALNEGTLRGESQRLSDEILSKPISETQALAKAKEAAKDNPELRDALVDRIHKEYSLREQAKRNDEENSYRRYSNLIDGGGSFNQIPPAEVAAMTPEMKVKLQTYEKNKIEGRLVATKPEVYYQLRTMFEDPGRRNEAIKYNLLQNLNDVSGDELKQLMNLQAGLRKGDDKTIKLLDGFQSDRNVVDGILVEAGINPKAKPTTTAGKQTARFYEAVDKRVLQFQTQTGKKANNDDIRRMADELIMEVVTDRGVLWDTKKRKFELDPGEQFDVNVPKADADEIARILKKRGKPATPDEIKRIYLKGKNSGG